MIPKCFVIYGRELQLPWGFWVAANCCLLHWAVLALNTAVNHWEAFAVLTREHFRSSQGPRWNRLSMLCSKTGTRLYTHTVNFEPQTLSSKYFLQDYPIPHTNHHNQTFPRAPERSNSCHQLYLEILKYVYKTIHQTGNKIISWEEPKSFTQRRDITYAHWFHIDPYRIRPVLCQSGLFPSSLK